MRLRARTAIVIGTIVIVGYAGLAFLHELKSAVGMGLSDTAKTCAGTSDLSAPFRRGLLVGTALGITPLAFVANERRALIRLVLLCLWALAVFEPSAWMPMDTGDCGRVFAQLSDWWIGTAVALTGFAILVASESLGADER